MPKAGSIDWADDQDFTRCNTCGYVFKLKRHGFSVDMDNFRSHKLTCVPATTDIDIEGFHPRKFN